MALYPLFRPLMFALDAERAHRATISALKLLPAGMPAKRDPLLSVNVAGLDFPNPVGLAAGFDKDAEVFAQMLGFGFGFVEVGTLTPRPQEGNPKPRLFRLARDRGVINRLGFNNRGQEDAVSRLSKRPGIVGVNIGANKDAPDRIADYAGGVRRMAAHADYLTVNISSPNTPGLRALQDKVALDDLLAAAMEARGEGPPRSEAAAGPGPAGPPIFLKVAPDLERGEIDDVVEVAAARRVDAIIIGNTTLSRPELRSRQRGEAGGLSGAPLKLLALEKLRDFARASGGTMPLIAAGGIENGVDAFLRIRSGASLVQLYSALVYQGPDLASAIASELRTLLQREGHSNVREAIGTDL
jgi:dihydroorotate dehydrogenase